MQLMKNYLYKVLIALSMLINVILGGVIGQTLSARQHQRRRDKQWHIAWLIDLFCGKGHCILCWASWMVRKW